MSEHDRRSKPTKGSDWRRAAQGSSDIVKSYRTIGELLPETWSSGKVHANGINHHYYRSEGDDPPVLLMHGFLEGALSWLRTARALDGDYNIIMVDARGHGLSDRTLGRFSQDLLTADAAGVVRALRIGPCRLLGFSRGGATVIHLAAADPELVQSLIVAGWSEGGEVRADFTESEGYQAWFQEYLSWLGALKGQTHEERMASALSQLPPGAPIPPEDEYVPWVEDCAHLDLDLVRTGDRLWADVGQRRSEMVSDLRGVTCPTLVMKSEFSPMRNAPPAVVDEDSNQPNVRIVRFTNTGHLIHREQFDRFIGFVRSFFDQARRGSSDHAPGAERQIVEEDT